MSLRTLFAVTLLTACALLPAHAVLDDAYMKDADYATAQRGLLTAQDDLAKAKADPEPVPLTLARAGESVEQTSAALRLAKVSARAKVAIAVGDLVTARRKVAAEAKRQEVSQVQVQAAQVRFAAGAISTQDLAKVKDTAAKQDAALADAKRALDGAESRVRIYGEVPEGQPLPMPEKLDAAKLSIENGSLVIAARLKVSEAERALALAQGPDTAPLDRSSLERALASAKDSLRDVRRVQQDALDNAARRVTAAGENLKLAESGLGLADTALATARKRLAAGAIARQALLEAESAQADAAQARDAAVAEMWNATLAWEQAAGGL
jgi:outer membrane protein TolC